MLDRFPAEIIRMVLQLIPERADLKSLSEVSRRLHRCTVPVLYKSITFFASAEQNLTDFGVESFLKRNARYLQYAKNLQFAAHFHRRLRNRCIEYDVDDYRELDDDGFDSTSDDNLEMDDGSVETMHGNQPSRSLASSTVSAHENFLEVLESRLIPLFHQITDGSLESFSWNLGTCMPKAVVDFLSTKQPQIAHLSTTTDTTCIDEISHLSRCRFHRFSQLRSISWTPVGSADMETLIDILRCSAHLLEDVEINCISVIYPKLGAYIAQNRFAHTTPTLIPGEHPVLFRSLRRLSLSGLSFRDGTGDIISAFNFPQLRSLKLSNCEKTNTMLDTLASFSQSMRLTDFELNFPGLLGEQLDIMPLARFLRSFRGLVNLYILCPQNHNLTEAYWRSLAHHSSTLEKVTHQQDEVYQDLENVRGSDGIIRALLASNSLHCLGICCFPNDLTKFLVRTNFRPKLKLLHIRVAGWVNFRLIRGHTTATTGRALSGSLFEVFHFAQWAFGPDGLPELEILAYGDFSYQGRQLNILLCRSEDLMESELDEPKDRETAHTSKLPYREVTKKDVRLRALVREHSDLLEACPEDRLLH